MGNHSKNIDPEMEAFLKKEQEIFKEMGEPLGGTGQHPAGKLTQLDHGELRLAITRKDDKVIINFGEPVAWIAFSPEQALDLANLLISRASRT